MCNASIAGELLSASRSSWPVRHRGIARWLVLMVLVISPLSLPRQSMAQSGSWNAWLFAPALHPWLAQGYSDVAESFGGPITTGVSASDSINPYGEAPRFSIMYKLRDDLSGFASLFASAPVRPDGANSSLSASASQVYLDFSFLVPEDTTFDFSYSGPTVYHGRIIAGSSGTIFPTWTYDAGDTAQFSLFAAAVNGDNFARVNLSWGPVGYWDFIGKTINDAIKPDLQIDRSNLPPGAGTRTDCTGRRASVTHWPVNAGFGLASATYFGGEAPSGDPAPPEQAAIGYGYFSDGPMITSLVLPDALPNGDGQFDLVVNGASYPVNAGTLFDFTSLAPEGVSFFEIMGIDPAEGFSPLSGPSFAVGLTFASAGETDLYTLTYSPAPEPSAVFLLVTGALTAVGWRRYRAAKGATQSIATGLPWERESGHH